MVMIRIDKVTSMEQLHPLSLLADIVFLFHKNRHFVTCRIMAIFSLSVYVHLTASHNKKLCT